MASSPYVGKKKQGWWSALHLPRVLAAIEDVGNKDHISIHVVDHLEMANDNAPMAFAHVGQVGFNLPSKGEFKKQFNVLPKAGNDPVDHTFTPVEMQKRNRLVEAFPCRFRQFNPPGLPAFVPWSLRLRFKEPANFAFASSKVIVLPSAMAFSLSTAACTSRRLALSAFVSSSKRY